MNPLLNLIGIKSGSSSQKKYREKLEPQFPVKRRGFNSKKGEDKDLVG